MTGQSGYQRSIRRRREALVPRIHVIGNAHTWHRGELARSVSLLSAEAGTVTVPVIKRAEDGSGWVLRVWEHSGQPTTARIGLAFCGRDWPGQLGPHQVRTLHVPDDPAEPVPEIDVPELNFREAGRG
jgi:alpha-mannosidase